MSVKIRLNRVGTKKRPMYRIVVADSRAPRGGKNIEVVGQFNPMVNPHVIKVDRARVDHWISKGAQPSQTVSALLKKAARASASAAS